MNASRFQVLSLDGGGMKGVFTAALLAAIEEDLDVRITEHFDLVAGTSTGGILALGLAIGRRPAELVEFYASHQQTIFKRRAFRRGVFRARYASTGLRAVLESVLGTTAFGESPVRLVIPSYDVAANEVYIFRTPHHERLRRDWRTPMVDVALATSAAPTFFPGHRLDSAVRLVDGGVWANNPSMTALVEAVETCGHPLEDIVMLSIGTTAEVTRTSPRVDRGGCVPWARPITNVFLAAQSQAARNHCSLLLPRGQFHRLDPAVPAGLFRLDRIDCDELIAVARTESRKLLPAITPLFDHRPVPYVPLYPRS